jgi:hypothetical protein
MTSVLLIGFDSEALDRALWHCAVIGGGIRKPDPVLEYFEYVVRS